MLWVWAGVAVVGLYLASWACLALPKGTNMAPVPPKVRIKSGPYRFLKHPMYVGNVLFVSGLAGMGAGIWNAFAVGFTAEMLMRHWASLEDGK